MPQSAQPRSSSGAFWRNAEVRAVFYQILVLGGVLFTAYIIFQNTLTNLEERGISSGFGFLKNEGGFGIGETPPVPLWEGGFQQFIYALTGGLLAAFLLNLWSKRSGRILGENTWLVSLVILVVFILPAATLYGVWGSIRSEIYTEASSYGIGLWTGLINTLKVSLVGCILATLLGLIIGIARLSSNWLIAKLAAIYVETLRNLPLLLQIFFWYFAVLRTLPKVRQSLTVGDIFILNNRGVYLPDPTALSGAGPFTVAVGLALIGTFYYNRYVKKYQEATGQQLPLFLPAIGLLIVLPGISWVLIGAPFALTFPELKGFNYRGGIVLTPEFASMLTALVLYTASYVAEIVRSGIEAVSKGQLEASGALGLRQGQTMRLVILPQALRVIIPPMTSQYLNLTKNSSLGVAIGFPELVNVGGTILNQSGQAIEVIGITMAVYLTFSLLISLFMNWYNAKVKLVER